MPAPALYKMAKNAGMSKQRVERYWNEAKKSARKQGIYKKDGAERYYRYVMGIVTKRMKYKEIAGYIILTFNGK